jgi:hypothetical protein
MVGCKMNNYVSDKPLTILNPNAVVQAFGCLDKEGNTYNFSVGD